MSDVMILLTPFLVLLVLALFKFTGCTTFTEAPESSATTRPGPPLVIGPPDPPPAKPAAEAYQELITATAGFAAFWPLNESGGNVANVVGPLNPAANGLYVSPGAPAGSGYSVGQNGVLFHKDTKDFAPEFSGTVAYVEVQFNGPLNPVKTVSAFSIELWAKPNPAAGGMTQVLISSHRNESAGVQQGYEIALVKNAAQPNQQIRGRVFANGLMTETLVTPLQGNADEWRHIVLTYEQSATVGPLVTLQVRLAKSANTFKDGPHSAKYEGVVSTKPSTLRFGAGHATGQTGENFFAGRIDNVAFYNALLTQSEIDKHFAAF